MAMLSHSLKRVLACGVMMLSYVFIYSKISSNRAISPLHAIDTVLLGDIAYIKTYSLTSVNKRDEGVGHGDNTTVKYIYPQKIL